MRLTKRQAEAMGITVKDGKRKRSKAKQHVPDPQFDAMCKAHGLPIPVQEYKFHPTRKWRFDYLFDGWLAVEKEGGVFGKKCPTCKRVAAAGGHSSVTGIKRDIEKYNAAAMLGYTVLRFLPEQFDSGEAFATIREALERKEEIT